MKTIRYIFISFLFLIVLFLACGEEKDENKSDMSEFLPAQLEGIGLERTSEIRTFDGKSLWEYIDGGAEIYLTYNFIQVATADYSRDGIEIVVDIYQFTSEDNAYGLYSMFRTDDVQIIKLGVEGFTAPASLNFVKGKFLVGLIGYDDLTASSLALVNLAEGINKILPGTADKPVVFNIFPHENIITATDKYYTESFLGQKFLTKVFCQDYFIGGDTLTLFLTDDSNGAKYLEWLEIAGKTGRKESTPSDLPFDEKYVFIINDNYYGKIIAGLKDGKLLGIVNYGEKQRELLMNWLNSRK